ncbi:1-acyl-sn-glycerol-3-phosphate acyltransferase [Massilia sp. Se16.2.3]|nr:1-acyl-sn-glycerol-3-phosphate acyltransferase [Massilia sp. Se16.2.3]
MRLRLAWRLVRVIVHLLVGLLTCAPVFPRARRRLREAATRRWSRRLLGICGVRVEAFGAAALEHALFVANHISRLDIFVINSVYPCRFVAKAEIRAWPVLGWLADAAGTVFLARGNRRELRHIFKGLVAVLEQGERVAFFPEGTVGTRGEVLPFHANLFEAAVDAQVAVQPCALAYLDAHGSWHRGVDYAGEVTFVQSIMSILGGPPVHARLSCLVPIAGAGAHRRELAQAAHEAIARALVEPPRLLHAASPTAPL